MLDKGERHITGGESSYQTGFHLRPFITIKINEMTRKFNGFSAFHLFAKKIPFPLNLMITASF